MYFCKYENSMQKLLEMKAIILCSKYENRKTSDDSKKKKRKPHLPWCIYQQNYNLWTHREPKTGYKCAAFQPYPQWLWRNNSNSNKAAPGTYKKGTMKKIYCWCHLNLCELSKWKVCSSKEKAFQTNRQNVLTFWLWMWIYAYSSDFQKLILFSNWDITLFSGNINKLKSMLWGRRF